MTDIMTSQNIDLSSWDTLCKNSSDVAPIQESMSAKRAPMAYMCIVTILSQKGKIVYEYLTIN
jgi:hypothetical protein